MADLFKILQPLQFLQTFLKKGTRSDGRKFNQSRSILLTCDCISTANGSALVKFGTSSAVCGIKTSLVKPPSDKPDKGIIDVEVNFSNTCSTDLENPDRTSICDLVRECIKKVLFHAKVVDLNALCLVPRKHVWKLELEIICLNLNGSIVDLSLLAAICALKFCKLRKYDIDLDFDTIAPTETFEALQVQSYPIFTTFCIVKDSLLEDPLVSEEELSDSMIRIAVDSRATSEEEKESSTTAELIYFFEVTGSKEIETATLEKCYRRALSRARFIRGIIDKHTTVSNREVEIKFEEPMEAD
ncbi:hypothetical protein TYRP_007659 [Tyrophagus putrescentiae]|nr:hypothetical protein TYRP_007659 [Tyrophagus putrescentiae]